LADWHIATARGSGFGIRVDAAALKECDREEKKPLGAFFLPSAVSDSASGLDGE
jgi:hypothetical protein